MADWPEQGKSARFVIDGPAGDLECLVERPAIEAKGIMLICHPHPQFGGTMDNKVVYSLARAAVTTGWTAVRFNFRGIGKSAGCFDDGVGEQDDALAALEYALSHQPSRVLLSGFSFGSAVALRLSQKLKPVGMISVAPPLRYFDNETLPEPGCPWLVVHGDQDDVVSCEETFARLEQVEQQVQAKVMEGAGHFFHGQLTDLRQHVEPFIESIS